MRFSAPILLTTAALLIAGSATAGSASAAPLHPSAQGHAVQGQPTSVVASGTATSVTLSWEPSTTAGSGGVAAYSTLLTPGWGQPFLGLKVVRPSIHSVTYDHLTTGKTYSLSVSAEGRYGISKPVTVRYTAQNPKFLFAIDSTGTLVKTPAAGGTPVTVQAGAQDYAVDAAGDAFVLTATSVVEVPVSGSPTTLLSGVTGATALQLDGKNDVYLQEGDSVVELPVGATATSAVVTSPIRIQGWSVNPAGTVSVFEAAPESGSTVVSVPAGGAATTRILPGSPYESAFSGQFDAKGDVYFSNGTTGASGAETAESSPAGTTTVTAIGGGNFLQGVGLTDSDYLLQSASWCPVPSLNSGSCVPDLTVANITVISDTGTSTSVPVTGLTVGRAKFTSGAAKAVTSDTAGTIYVTETAGVFSYAAAGGAPTQVLSGSYSDVKLNY